MDFSKQRTVAYISLKNAEHNYKVIEGCTSPGVKIMPVIKADGYGHGAVKLAQLYTKLGAYAFCVACLDEAIELRESGVSLPIIILGPTSPECVRQLLHYDICQTIHMTEYAQLVRQQIPQGKKLKIQIKLETGMKRIGFDKDQNPQQLLADPKFEVCGVFTHFAASDNLSWDFTQQQLECYNKQLEKFKGVPILRHTCNSAGIMSHKQAHFDAVRPGIILYGSYPSDQVKEEFEKNNTPILEVMTFCSHITNIFKVKKGESIGYSRTFYAPRDMRVATVCAGYADGVMRHLSNKGKIGVNGSLYNIVGNVCMDQLMIDITDSDGINLFDSAVIFGQGGMHCEQVASICNSISHEVLCAVSKRVPRIYID